ncbi:serine/threonine-protein kinase Nek4 isoform X1 [Erpetoichthys calabaricus]|uniref:serine/threonine-protein kinase Nek4 isoform X1 n=1 Tax=Erpetoichthys calabaricus TaxID=27687 RepID=UPI00109FEE19|nr:serine/threonine-protein kinase Nek4 isoform X1 [Erpetoichthys calabaricus]
MDNYSFIRVVGKGSYGEVQLVKHRIEGKQYVVKKLNLQTSSRKERKAAEQEAQLLSRLRHPNIVTYRESWEGDDGQLYIVMGFCEGGDLYHRLKEQKGHLLAESQVVEWFVQIAMALQYLHEKHILHRDLKTQNIFLTKTNIIKVGDLGIARVLENQNDMANTLIGTPYYMSPELFSNKPYNYKSDVWALGCCAYEIATLKHAFNAKDMNSLVYRIVEGKLPQMPKDYNPQLGEIIRSMLNKKPEDRPDVKQILRQPYIKGQIAVFLEATKMKTAKPRKKESNRRPEGSSSTPSNVHLKQQEIMPHHPRESNKKLRMNEEKGAKKIKKHDLPLESPLPAKPSLPPAFSGDAVNTLNASLATLSKVDIDMKPDDPNKRTPDPETEYISNVTSAEELKKPSKVQELYRRLGSKTAEKSKRPVAKQNHFQNMDENEDTAELLRGLPSKTNSADIQESFESTEMLLEPFVAVKVDDSFGDAPARLQPHSSSSEPSVSRQRRVQNKEHSEEFRVVPPRPLPCPPQSTNTSHEKKNRSNLEIQQGGISRSLCGSKNGDVIASQERPLSARERRRLKQSQEDFFAVNLPRRASHDVVLDSKKPSAGIIRSSSDLITHKEKQQVAAMQHLSDEDECSSSTSSTDRSEGECKDGKSDFNEMQDLVQLMTQTLKMDSKELHGTPSTAAAAPEFKLNRKYRDTLLLHGKAHEEQREFHFGEFPSDSTCAHAKIKRTIESMRTNVMNGIGVKLLDKVLDIMEEVDEEQREVRLQEHLGEEKYREYAVMVKQLKFLEDLALNSQHSFS